jgi:Zn-finger protein
MDKITYIRVTKGINAGITGYISDKHRGSCRACLWIERKQTYRILHDDAYEVIKPATRRCVD